jgi:hypothetical protein
VVYGQRLEPYYFIPVAPKLYTSVYAGALDNMMLGLGASAAWDALVEQDLAGDCWFTGPESTALYGGGVPLDYTAAHWLEGTTGLVDGVPQETLMDPSTPFGERQRMTDLDWAGLSDVGWVVIPEPSTALLVGLGLTFAGRTRRAPSPRSRRTRPVGERR